MQNTENMEIYFAGSTGNYYRFMLFPLKTDLPNTGAVYILSRKSSGSYKSLYIGETQTLSNTIQEHENWVSYWKWSIDSVCVYFENDPDIRQKIEQDLIGVQCPPCNKLDL